MKELTIVPCICEIREINESRPHILIEILKDNKDIKEQNALGF